MNKMRFKQLLESKMGNVKPLINEESLKITPYTLEATPHGRIKITNSDTNKTYYYDMYVDKVVWVRCKVKDFPGGKKIKVEAVGGLYEKNVDTDELKTIFQTKFGNNTLITSTKDGTKVKFEKYIPE